MAFCIWAALFVANVASAQENSSDGQLKEEMSQARRLFYKLDNSAAKEKCLRILDQDSQYVDALDFMGFIEWRVFYQPDTAANTC